MKESKKPTIWEKLEKNNKNARYEVREAQLASDQAEGLSGILGKYRLKELGNQQPPR